MQISYKTLGLYLVSLICAIQIFIDWKKVPLVSDWFAFVIFEIVVQIIIRKKE